ncbi:Hpt domain-containing protein [Pedobacter sp. SYSU D00535]|uniref:Hpt domain-containing protein n=1 Tax=Pedobacter sp. SYSU D00535 TaxID=2810308 RepID=UPI001A959C14|nr:Hpt domain-containing protein [Pedobacter sp. SYSU D00535]
MAEATNNSGIDLSYLSEIAGGSAEFMIEMIDIFIEQTPLYMEQMEEAVKASDWKGVGDVAHKIKPTLAFMGLESAKEQMAEIERKARTQDGVEAIEGQFYDIKQKCNNLYQDLDKAREELKAQL